MVRVSQASARPSFSQASARQAHGARGSQDGRRMQGRRKADAREAEGGCKGGGSADAREAEARIPLRRTARAANKPSLWQARQHFSKQDKHFHHVTLASTLASKTNTFIMLQAHGAGRDMAGVKGSMV